MAELCRRARLEPALGGTRPSFVHVAGTNGKGSTTAFLQSLFVESGVRAGAFFSPYVVDYRERIQIGRDLIPKEELASLTEELLPVAESLTDTGFGGVTKFEFEAALGFLFWKRRHCDWVALEVGLGGRLDATNVVRPACCVIVSIGLDHLNVLGDTLEKIAAEKAGIIKPGVPLALGWLPAGARAVVLRAASKVGSPVWEIGREILVRKVGDEVTVTLPGREYRSLKPGLAGVHQGHNLGLALAALELAGLGLDQRVAEVGAARASAPGRFQVVRMEGRTLILDGAHNRDAALALRRTFQEQFPGLRVNLVANMLVGHDLLPFFEELRRLCDSIEVVPIDFHRAVSPIEAARILEGFPRVTARSTLREGLQAALDAADESHAVLVTGSNYLVGEALGELGLADSGRA